jgi:glycosyltransferase involved in cell wall biosynthesis
MKIIVISQYFPPDITAAAFRIGDTVEILSRRHHDICVLTAQPHRSQVNLTEPDRGELLNVKINRSKIFPLGKGGFLKYVIHYLSFVFGSSYNGILLYKNWRPLIIWASSPPLFTGFTALLIKKIFGTPFVLDIRDIWPESAVSAGQISRNGVAFRIGKAMEKILYDGANHITCVSSFMGQYIRKKTSTPVTTIYNGVKAEGRGKKGYFSYEKTILYAGNFGRVQGLEILIQGFAELRDKECLKDWNVVLIGTGANEDKIKKLITKLDLEQSIAVYQPMPRDQVFKKMNMSGLLFMNLMPDEVFKLTIPSKVFDYMLAGRPILAGISGEGKRILESTGGNVCFVPCNIKSFKESLVKICSNLSFYEEKASKNYEYVICRYTREMSTFELIKVFEQVAETSTMQK